VNESRVRTKIYMKIEYVPIGTIHTEFIRTEDAPIQGVFAEEAGGKVEIFSEYASGLKDIESFSHVILIYHCHLAKGYSLISRPFLDDKDRGIFSIRHFKRPNPIGLSIVKLERVVGNILEISEVDIINGTPLLDIKPFIPLFDNRIKANNGWVGSPGIDMERGEAGKHRDE